MVLTLDLKCRRRLEINNLLEAIEASYDHFERLCQFKFSRGVQGQKNWIHNFEITSDPKGPSSGSTFWLGFEVPDPYWYLWGHILF